MKRLGLILFVVAGLGLISPDIWAQEKSTEERLAALEQEVAILRRNLELEKEEAKKKAGESAVVTASAKDGFQIKAPDDSFKIRLRGYFQADARFFTDNKKDIGTTDTLLVRRAAPGLEGSLGKNASFSFVPEFGGGSVALNDAYIDYKFAPVFGVRGGKFKVPLSLERLQSSTATHFTELGLATNLTPNRDVGFQLSGALDNETLNYSLGVFNGAVDNGTIDGDSQNDKDLVGRLWINPFKNRGPERLKGLGIGVAGSYGHREGSLQTYRSIGQASIFSYSSTTADGTQQRIVPQVSFYNGSLGLQGEYVRSQQDVARVTSGTIIKRDSYTNTGWQITGSYVLTGELASYKGVVPRQEFAPGKGTLGAWELVGRYSALDVDDQLFTDGYASLNSNVSGAKDWGVGLNWYWNRNVRWSLDYDRTEFDRGAQGGSNRTAENLILSRFQIAY